MRRIRVVLVEDNDAYRETLAFLLAGGSDVEVVGQVATGAEAAAACAELRADVAVVDLRLPDMDGGEAAADVRERSPSTSVVFLSASAGPGERAAASRTGSPFVGKGEGIDALVAAIRASAGGVR
jgi:DNA-binding NarL/FixJ family response regulator